jgi:hypothetical protein
MEIRSDIYGRLIEQPGLTIADGPLIELAVDALAKVKLIVEHLDRTSGGSLLDTRGKVRKSADTYFRAMHLAQGLLRDLGLGPVSRAKIMSDLGPSVSLAKQLASRRVETAALAAHPE